MNLETPAPCTSCFSNPKGMAFHSHGPKCCEFQTTGYLRGERTKQLALQSKRDFFFPVWCHTILLVTFLCPDIVIRIYFQGRLGYVVFILMDVCSVKNSVTMKGGKNEYWGATVYSVPLLSNCLRRVFVLLSWYFRECPLVVPTACLFPICQSPTTKLCTVVEENIVGNALKKNHRVIMFNVLVIYFYVGNHSKSLWFKTINIYNNISHDSVG